MKQGRRRNRIAASAALLAGAYYLAGLLTQSPEAGRLAGPGGLPRPPSSGPPRRAPDHPGPAPSTAPAPRAIARLGSGPYAFEVAAGELLVRVREHLTPAGVETLAARLGSQVLAYGTRSGLYRLKLPEGESLAGFQALLQGRPEILEARPNAIAEGANCPAGTYRSKQWNLDRIQSGAACELYQQNLATVTVAVLDTGIAYETRTENGVQYTRASDLAGVPFAPGYDFVNDDPNPNDDHQHGTHMAGIIAAAGKVSGVAPAVRLMPVKVLGADKRGTEFEVVEGIYYAVDHGADVINLSLSFGLGFFPGAALQEAVSYAVDHGVVLVAAAGNHGATGIPFPAAFPDVISVGASRLANGSGNTLQDRHAYYSNRGFRLDLLAPGGLLTTDLDKDRVPDATLAQTFARNRPDLLGYYLFTGTSGATAHVSGAAAWLLADGAAPGQVKPLLQRAADGLGLTDYHPFIGSGILRLQDARNLISSGAVQTPPRYYVNLLPVLEGDPGEDVRAVVRIEVMDEQGRPAAGVRVAGSWYGSYTGFDTFTFTNQSGIAYVASETVASSRGVAFGFQVDQISAPNTRVPGAPRQFYSLTPAMAEGLARLMEDPVARESVLLFRTDPADPAMGAIHDRSDMIPGYVMKPVGPGMRSGPLVVVFDDAFAPELAQAAAVPLDYQFPAPLHSGWGDVMELRGSRLDVVVPRLGPASRYVVLPLDPAMARLDRARAYPVINSYPSEFLTENITFGDGFASSTLGDGFASSTLGDGFASSTLGDGFASSTLGSGFASSTLGSGFASSTLGSGFASSTLGSGFASSTLGSGFASSTLGSSTTRETSGHEDEAIDMVLGNSMSGEDSPCALVSSGDEVTVASGCVLIEGESSLLAETGQEPFPPLP